MGECNLTGRGGGSVSAGVWEKIGERSITVTQRGEHVFGSFVDVEPYPQLLIRVKGTATIPVVPSGLSYSVYVRIGALGADQHGNCVQLNVGYGTLDSGKTVAFESGTTAIKGWWLRQGDKLNIQYYMPEFSQLLHSPTPDLLTVTTTTDGIAVSLVETVYGLKLQ